ncbi:hypothetical protein D3C84_1099370 [compost metagenome]
MGVSSYHGATNAVPCADDRGRIAKKQRRANERRRFVAKGMAVFQLHRGLEANEVRALYVEQHIFKHGGDSWYAARSGDGRVCGRP